VEFHPTTLDEYLKNGKAARLANRLEEDMMAVTKLNPRYENGTYTMLGRVIIRLQEQFLEDIAGFEDKADS
jgi:hypothetical protein